MTTEEARETLREVMGRFDSARTQWIALNGNDIGFDAWFTSQIKGREGKGMTTQPLFTAGDIIDVYTREQAIEDGVLVDLSETAREVGIKFPTAVTRAVWSDIVEPDEIAKSHGESEAGRLWDVVWMLRVAIKAGMSGDILRYYMLATKGGKKHKRELKAVCGPGDNAEPVITVMLPNED